MMFGSFGFDDFRRSWEFVIAIERDRARRSPINYARTKKRGHKKRGKR